MSAAFEWTISFWYGLLLLLWSMDLFPSAVKHYRVHHPEEFDEVFIDRHQGTPVEMADARDTIPRQGSAGENSSSTARNLADIPKTEPSQTLPLGSFMMEVEQPRDVNRYV